MNSVISELLKLKRNTLLVVLFFCVVASPLLTVLLISVRGEGTGDVTWTLYALQSQLPIYICTLAFSIISAAIVFAGEFQQRTINVLFASTGSRISVVAAKHVAVFLVLFAVIIPTAIVNLIVGVIVSSDSIDGPALAKYTAAVIWSIPGYFALVPAAALLGVLLKKPALSSLIYFTVVIMIFPFYEQAVFIPPLLPMHLAMKLIAAGSDLSSVAFLNSSLRYGGTALSLGVFFAVPLFIEVIYVRRMDVCS